MFIRNLELIVKKSTFGADAPLAFARACYQLAWRWHCYAGLFVIPFLLMLSITGTVMLYDDQIQQLRYPQVQSIEALEAPLPASIQLAKVKALYPNAVIKKYIPARAADEPSFFVVRTEGATLHLAVDPYRAKILTEIDRDDSWYALANDIHGTLLLGDTGDKVIEIATGLIILLIVSGIYLWLPRRSPAKRLVLWPRWNRGKRTFYRELHSSLGLYSVIFLLFFVLSGLAWSGVWGGKFVQAWNSFPAEKWDAVPLSEVDHSSMNQGVMEEVPWTLEQTPLPLSDGQGKTLNIDQLTALASSLGMEHYQLNLATTPSAVFTLSADTMSGDITDPRLDRTVHINQYSGAVLADVGFEQYSFLAKAMAAGIALHQGDVSWVNLAVNTLLCLVFSVICFSGIWLWWSRRPKDTWRINAPSVKTPVRWKSAVAVIVVIAVLFPLTGLALLTLLFLDSVVQLGLAIYRRLAKVA